MQGTINHGPKKIESKQQCIYCGKRDVELTDEHIVPYFISGDKGHILLKSSCKECAKITSKFERDVAKGLWDDARSAYNAPSRRMKKRPKYVYLDDQINLGGKLKIPYEEYPALMIFYKMHIAGLLMGYNRHLDTSNTWQFIAVTDQKKTEDFEKKYPGQLTAKIRFNHDSYARFIIKMGYCQVMTSLDPGDFRPICLPYIFGNESNCSFVLGSKPTIDEPTPHLGYNLRTISCGTSDYLLIVAEVRIVANNHTPTYHVVVGDVKGEDKVNYVRAKLDGPDDFSVTYTSVPQAIKSDEYYWMPRVWPLNNL